MPAPAPFLAVTDLRSGTLTPAELTAALPRPELDVEAAAAAVRPVVEDVAARGAEEQWLPVGKTFKGMTDEMLAWQTERFLELETHREAHVVHVRPEQVVEVAVDGVQRSTRYAGGVALRFARVVRYREDKAPAEADTIETVQGMRGTSG